MKISVLQSPLRAQPSQPRIPTKFHVLNISVTSQYLSKDLVHGHIRGQDQVHGHMESGPSTRLYGLKTEYLVIWGQDRVHGHMGSGPSTQAYGVRTEYTSILGEVFSKNILFKLKLIDQKELNIG